MDVYVKTAGKRIELEYDWYRITPQALETAAPPLLLEFKVDSLLQDQSFSIVLARSRGRLILLVESMKSGRSDFAARPLRNYVAWVGGPSDEAALRATAALALRGGLDVLVDAAITEDRAGGFDVSCEKLEAIPASPELMARAGHARPDPQSRWGPNSNIFKLGLADELEGSRLPDHDGPLVVVTGITSPERLAAADVWRALASTIKTTHLTPIPKKKRRLCPKFFATRWTKSLLIFLLISLAFLIVTQMFDE
jgi:hypothetical protein